MASRHLPSFLSSVRRIATLPAWSVVAIVAVAVRLVTLGDPVVHVDEEFYYVTAHEMWRGALPFVDIWDRKPVGLFLLYMPPALLPLHWGILTYQAMATASLILTALLVMRMARVAGWATGGTAAAIAYVLWPNLLNGVGGQSPIFYNLPMAAAATLIVSARGQHRRAFGCLAMALVGLALQIKYSAVFEGLFFGLWLLWQDWRTSRSPFDFVLYGAAMVALALAPTLAAWGWYVAHGHGDAFVFCNFVSVGQRSSDPIPEALGNIGKLTLLLSPIVAMTFGARGQASGGSEQARHFLFCWFGVALLALALFGTWFDHYGLPSLVPGSVCTAGFFANRRFRRLGPVILMLVAVVGQITVMINIGNRGNATQFTALADAVGTGPGCLYVYSGTSLLYAESGRCRLTRYIFPSSLTRARDANSLGVDPARELRHILAARPAVVVMRPAFRGERQETRRIVLEAMERDYRLAAQVPMGREAISVYKLPGVD